MRDHQRSAAALILACCIALLAACANDAPVAPAFGNPQIAALAKRAEGIPALEMDLPAEPRAWDTDPAALAERIRSENGHAVIAFKSPGSPRILSQRGQKAVRHAVPSAAIQQGLAVLDAQGVDVIDYFESIGAAHVRIDPDAAVRLFDHPLIDYIEPRQWARLSTSPTSPAVAPKTLFVETVPWGISTIRATSAWTKTRGAGSKVLVIDTGHDRGHEDLRLISTSNCGGLYDGCQDGTGTAAWHGTHVLGIATALDNSVGVIGVAPSVQDVDIYSWGACSHSTGSCDYTSVEAGLQAGINWGVDVVNMSFSGPYDGGVANMISAANQAGIVLVAGAGNHCHDFGCPSNAAGFPATDTKVVGVSGINSNKTFAHPSNNSNCATGLGGEWRSNYGIHVDLSAPFDANSSIGNDSYQVKCGTSMAAPYVTGVVALVRAIAPSLTPLKVWQRLYDTAEDLGPSGWDQEFGEGMVDAYAATGPHVSVEGPHQIPSGTSCEWQGDAAGGYSSLSYEWYKDGVLVDTGVTFSTSGSSVSRSS